VEVVPTDEVLQAFEGWGKDITSILQHVKEPSRWAIHTVYPPLESYVRGRVVLIGDAVSDYRIS